MKDLKDENANVQKVEETASCSETIAIPQYKEFLPDGKKYYEFSQIDDFNIMLMCESKNGIVLLGPKGCGKTTFMKRFVQQDLSKALGINSVKVVQIFDEFVSEGKDEEALINKIVQVCSKYANDAIIMYFKANDENTLLSAIKLFDKYVNKIKEKCGISFFKLVIEYSFGDKKDLDRIKTLDIKSFCLYYAEAPYDLKKRLKIYALMAKELSNVYNVKISKKMTYYASIVILGCIKDRVNLHEFYNILEFPFAFARRKQSKRITKNIIAQTFPEMFGEMGERGKEQILRIAYHESGHATFVFINSNYRDLDVVAVVPGESYGGVTRHSNAKDARKYIRDRKAVIYEIAGTIAGREAERLIAYPYNPDKGARSDLEHARELADELIFEFGISSSIGNNCVLKKDEPISEKLRCHIERERQQIIEEATKIAFEAVFKHKAFIEKLANKLVTDFVVSGNDARKMWEQHLNELAEKKKKLNE